jgi:two-component system, OmpR family, KDP operon response regulator KdpE
VKEGILIIDDEDQMRKLLEITLKTNEFEVIEAATGREGRELAIKHNPEMIILDLALPDEHGHVVLKKLREWYTNPILILSVQNSEDDIIKGLDNGANDYLVKPFRTGELLARIRSALRSSNKTDNNPALEFGDLVIDQATKTVRKKGEQIKLTATEYNLLVLLSRNSGQVLTHAYLLRAIWGPGYITQSQYLRVFIAQIRKKIEEDPNRPRMIITESGIGYRFVNPAE